MTPDRQALGVLDEIAADQAELPQPRDFAGKLARAREQTDGLVRFSPPVPRVQVETRMLDCAGHAIPAEIYGGGEGLLLWFHGGGAIAGSLRTHRSPLAELARVSGWRVASIEYPLAPEHPFPVPLCDCLAAARLFGSQERVFALGGDSIGGTFATVTARLLAEEGRAPLVQVLLYPNTDMREDRQYPSLTQNEGRIMTRASLAFEAGCHLPDRAHRKDARVSPLLAPDLSPVPPTFLGTCEGDPLRDEGEAYGQRLAQAGVALTHRRYDGMIHAFLQMGARLDATADLIGEVAAFLNAATDRLEREGW